MRNLLALVILGASYIIKSKIIIEKKFHHMNVVFNLFKIQSRFDVKFYLVAILFIIFDLEIAYLFPWSLCLDELNIEGVIYLW